jgi:hypothetical protein
MCKSKLTKKNQSLQVVFDLGPSPSSSSPASGTDDETGIISKTGQVAVGGAVVTGSPEPGVSVHAVLVRSSMVCSGGSGPAGTFGHTIPPTPPIPVLVLEVLLVPPLPPLPPPQFPDGPNVIAGQGGRTIVRTWVAPPWRVKVVTTGGRARLAVGVKV